MGNRYVWHGWPDMVVGKTLAQETSVEETPVIVRTVGEGEEDEDEDEDEGEEQSNSQGDKSIIEVKRRNLIGFTLYP